MAVGGFSCQDKRMTGKDGANDKKGRAERLANALRDNLKRRKAQARNQGCAPAQAGAKATSDD